MHLHHEGNESLVLDIGCHEWYNGVRLLGIKEGASLGNITQGPQPYMYIRKYWPKLMKPVHGTIQIGFCKIMKIGDKWFTEYPKHGDSMDNWEPEFLVTSMEQIGGTKRFSTTIGGYYGFFRYGLKEVAMIAPPGANAYALAGDPTFDGPERHKVAVKFYKITTDTSKRVMRQDELKNNYDTLMKLVEENTEE